MITEWEPREIEALAERIAEKVGERLKYTNTTTEPMAGEMMTVEEVATLLRVKVSRIYSWVNETKHGPNDFPFRKAGHSLRFSMREVLEWASKRAGRMSFEGKL